MICPATDGRYCYAWFSSSNGIVGNEGSSIASVCNSIQRPTRKFFDGAEIYSKCQNQNRNKFTLDLT